MYLIRFTPICPVLFFLLSLFLSLYVRNMTREKWYIGITLGYIYIYTPYSKKYRYVRCNQNTNFSTQKHCTFSHIFWISVNDRNLLLKCVAKSFLSVWKWILIRGVRAIFSIYNVYIFLIYHIWYICRPSDGPTPTRDLLLCRSLRRESSEFCFARRWRKICFFYFVQDEREKLALLGSIGVIGGVVGWKITHYKN